MPITNPNPVTPAACGQYWVSSITLSNPLFSAVLRPSDGQFVIANASKARRIVADASKDAAALAAVTAAFAQIQRVSGKAAAVSVLTVSEADPLSAIQLVAVFADKSVYRVADLMALVASDPQVAAAYAGVLAYLATK
ncbi:MAG: hypothetical protein ABR915_15380 [Thermoguttaceae bacterium]|jgi:hypothetical protein